LNNQSNIKDSSSAATVDNANSTVVSKLPPRPADYDYFYYQDEEGNWWNEYDDMGYEFDPNRYEGQEEPSSTEQVPSDAAKESSSAVDKKNKDVESSGGISELKVRLEYSVVNRSQTKNPEIAKLFVRDTKSHNHIFPFDIKGEITRTERD
jgi:hypothetical protein